MVIDVEDMEPRTRRSSSRGHHETLIIPGTEYRWLVFRSTGGCFTRQIPIAGVPIYIYALYQNRYMHVYINPKWSSRDQQVAHDFVSSAVSVRWDSIVPTTRPQTPDDVCMCGTSLKRYQSLIHFFFFSLNLKSNMCRLFTRYIFTCNDAARAGKNQIENIHFNKIVKIILRICHFWSFTVENKIRINKKNSQ